MADLSIFKLDNQTITIKDTTARQTAESAKTLATTASDNATTALNKVNEQFTELKNDLDGLSSTIFDVTIEDTNIPKGSDKLLVSTQHGYCNYASGVFIAHAGYDIYIIDITDETDCYITHSSSDDKAIGAILYNQHLDTLPTSSTQASEYFVKGARSDQTEVNALPSSDNRWSLTAGQMLAIFVQQRNTSGTATYNNDFILTVSSPIYALNNEVNLNSHQIAQATSKKPYVKYENVETEVESTGKAQLSIYIPTIVGYIKYAIVRREYNNKNYNTWQIYKCYACGDDKVIRYPITLGGEWEMAIKISGAPDFIGGAAHGDEILGAFTVFVDGKLIADITTIDAEFEELRLVETTALYDPSDGATLETVSQFTPIGTHGREYIFSKNGLRLLQNVILDTALTLDASYMTMLPILRGNDTASALQVTDHYYADNTDVIYDVSVGGINSEGYGWRPDVTRAVIYGVTSKVSAAVEMIKQPDIDNAGARLFQVQNTVNQYNKLYWSICGVNSNLYNASANERFNTESIFRIDVSA